MGKKKCHIYGLSALIALLCCCSSCQADKEVAPIEVHEGQKPLTLDMGLTLADLGDTDEAESRIIITERPATSDRAKGVNFGWSKGEVISDVYVRFRQGSKQGVSKGSLQILEHKPEGRTYKAKLSVTPPSGFNLTPQGNSFSGGDIYVSAAFGVDAVNNQGLATVKPKAVYEEGVKSDNPPMYAAEGKLVARRDNTGAILYSGPEEFRLFGILLRLHIANNSNMSYYPVKLTINPGLLDGNATFTITDGVRKGYADTKVQGINVLFGERSVPSKKAKNFYIWAYTQGKTGTRAAHLYNTYSWPEADVKKNIRIQAQAENHKVYNLPMSPTPQNGDLIFTEVLIRGDGGMPWSSNAFELYNPTDSPINLRQYSVRRRSSDAGGNQETGITSQIARTEHLWTNPNNKRDLILPPRKSILIIGKGQQLGPEEHRDLWNASKRPGLYYASRYNNTGSSYNAFHSARVSDRRNVAWQIVKGGKVIDEIFGDNVPIPAAITIMRKPGRNLPRTKMQMGRNTDWVTRQAKEQYDWGMRFGYYYEPRRVSGNFHSAQWLLDYGTLTSYDNYTSNDVVGFLNRAPLMERTSYNWGENYERIRDQAPYYAPPFWWTRSRAEAADR